MIRFRAPVRRDDDGFVVALSDDEVELVRRLLAELGELLAGEEPSELTARLFPVVHPDDPEQEAEYQRWMRPELVESKLAAIGTVGNAESVPSGRNGQPSIQAVLMLDRKSVV